MKKLTFHLCVLVLLANLQTQANAVNTQEVKRRVLVLFGFLKSNTDATEKKTLMPSSENRPETTNGSAPEEVTYNTDDDTVNTAPHVSRNSYGPPKQGYNSLK